MGHGWSSSTTAPSSTWPDVTAPLAPVSWPSCAPRCPTRASTASSTTWRATSSALTALQREPASFAETDRKLPERAEKARCGCTRAVGPRGAAPRSALRSFRRPHWLDLEAAVNSIDDAYRRHSGPSTIGVNGVRVSPDNPNGPLPVQGQWRALADVDRSRGRRLAPTPP